MEFKKLHDSNFKQFLITLFMPEGCLIEPVEFYLKVYCRYKEFVD